MMAAVGLPVLLVLVLCSACSGKSRPRPPDPPIEILPFCTEICEFPHTCQIINGKPVCALPPSSKSYCHAIGDPHYRNFDGRYFDFQGTCTYTIAKTCGVSFLRKRGLPYFNIEAKNEHRGNTFVSFVSLVKIQVYGFDIVIVTSEFGHVRVNNQRHSLPINLNNGQVFIHESSSSAVVETTFGLSVEYDWSSSLKVYVPDVYQNLGLCGLCGNFNADPSDDFTTPDGNLAPDVNDFGKSWRVEDGDRFCRDDCNGDCKTCPPEQQKLYSSEDSCGLLSQRGGPFSKCHSVLEPNTYVDNCVYDLCMDNNDKRILCQSLKSYADDCQRFNAPIEDWRTKAGCPMECPKNSQYEPCTTKCPATCNDKALPPKCSLALPCMESCQCLKGFVLQGGECIPRSSCGCLYEGMSYALNEEFWADDRCEKRCTCNPDTRDVECVASECEPSETCSVVNGIKGCHTSVKDN